MHRRAAYGVSALLAGALLAGCTTSGHAAESTASSTAASTPISTAPASSPPDTSTAPVTTPPSTPPSTSPATPQAAERSTCHSLTIRVLPGGAIAGQEVAGVQFTNSGATPCVLVGYPTVTLLRGGKQIGRPSEPAKSATSRRTLQPGEVAESLVHDYTLNCEAPLSDSVKVVVPGSSQSMVRPQFQMRGCILRADPLGPPQ
jgi:hypothetical protein